MAHTPVKPEKIVGVAAPLVANDLVLPQVMNKQSLEQYKGVKDDTLTFWVPGNLPARDYAWRNDRSAPIVFDEYAETKVTLTAGANAYSAVRLSDEQADMDFDGWTKLLDAQSRAVSVKLNHAAADFVAASPFQVVLKGVGSDLQSAFIKSRAIQQKFGAPGTVAIVGSDFEEAILKDGKLGFAANVGDPEGAQTALREGYIGRRYGYDFIVDRTIAPGKAYLLSSDAYVWLNMVPGIPRGVASGATTSYDSLAMRWICDYDTEYLRDRSVLNTYYGFQYVKDEFKFWDTSKTPNQETTQNSQAFVRAISLDLATGTNTLPAAGSDVAKATGVSA